MNNESEVVPIVVPSKRPPGRELALLDIALIECDVYIALPPDALTKCDGGLN